MANESSEDIHNILVQLENDRLIDVFYIERLAASPQEVQLLADKWGDSVYSSILRSLTHGTYSPNQAKSYWYGICQHRKSLIENLGRDPGIAVVALDYLTNKANPAERLAVIVQSQLGEIADFATKDELTGLYVRKIFESVSEQQVNEAHRYGNALCLLMCDIDDFKHYNDTYGHQAGDTILKRIGRVIMHTIRDSDIAARYGGEELSIIAPKTDLNEGFALAERLRLAVQQEFSGSEKITMSIGVAQLEASQTRLQLIETADKSLYRAKAQGKNQCFSFQQ